MSKGRAAIEVQIRDLAANQEILIGKIATMLMDAFREMYPTAFPTTERAVNEIRESLAPNHISRVALDDHGHAVGWIAGSSRTEGYAWELHPLVVRPDRQRSGIGRALVRDFEQRVIERGGLTIFLGTDDEQSQTSLGGVDLYPDVWPHLRSMTNLRHHPYEFYQKLGYLIVGVIPDANGFGKPDIFMAKRVGPIRRNSR